MGERIQIGRSDALTAALSRATIAARDAAYDIGEFSEAMREASALMCAEPDQAARAQLLALRSQIAETLRKCLVEIER